MSITFSAEATGSSVPALADLDVNVSSTNAAMLLALLGLPLDDEQCSAGDFLGRILIAQVLAPVDEGVPAHAESPRWVDCGRSAGYTQRRLGDLEALARAAVAANAVICWS